MVASISQVDDYCNRNHNAQLLNLVEGWDPPKNYPQPNTRLRAWIASMIGNKNEALESRTELDSHANMMVFGRNCEVISKSGKAVDVRRCLL